jgi:hypothetical protein
VITTGVRVGRRKLGEFGLQHFVKPLPLLHLVGPYRTCMQSSLGLRKRNAIQLA